MNQVSNVYTDFKRIEELVVRGLWRAIRYARGSCVSFTPKKILEYAEVDEAIPVVLTLVKHVLKQLSDKGYMEVDDSRSIVRFKICRESALWDVFKNREINEAISFVDSIIE